MIVLNLLNQLFGRRDAISRADIDTYKKDDTQRQRIEENAAADDFDNNALEGWSESGLDTNALKSLDRRIAKKYGSSSASSGVVMLLSVFLIASAGLLYYSYSPEKQHEDTQVDESLVLNQETERTEVDIRPEIENLIEIPRLDQVQPQELVAKNMAQLELNKRAPEDDPDPSPNSSIQTPELPVITNPTHQQAASNLVYNQAKEIYLKDLKLIDYREYRDGEVRTERLHYSGIPANQENWEQSNTEELVWEKVDIPYIEYIEKTMELLSKNKYKKALPRLELILENYPDDMNANFYSGFAYFNLGNYELAIQRFEKSYSISFGNFYEEARWFKSLALWKANKTSEARHLWKEIAAEKGFYANEAEKKLLK